MRWVRTGDIGMVYGDGVLAVVDRRKDLVKLERGEYLSLGKVESALQTEARLVAHALVLAHGHMRAPVALVAPHTRPLREALGADAPTEGDDDALLRCDAAVDAVMQDVRRAGRAAGLESWEVPTKARANAVHGSIAQLCTPLLFDTLLWHTGAPGARAVDAGERAGHRGAQGAACCALLLASRFIDAHLLTWQLPSAAGAPPVRAGGVQGGRGRAHA